MRTSFDLMFKLHNKKKINTLGTILLLQVRYLDTHNGIHSFTKYKLTQINPQNNLHVGSAFGQGIPK